MRFLIMALLALSIWIVPVSYEYADRERGYDATGGEMFAIILPIAIAFKALEVEEERYKRTKKREQKYKEMR